MMAENREMEKVKKTKTKTKKKTKKEEEEEEEQASISSSRRGVEVNTMTILDASGFNKPSLGLSDDRMAFLEAVRSASFGPENRVPPTRRMFEAIFQIFKDENSLELVMASYQLLSELEKSFPRFHVSEVDTSSPTFSSSVTELLAGEEVWLPFMFRSEGEDNAKRNSCASLDPSGFHLLIEDLVKVVSQERFEELGIKTLRNMLLVQYLISVLEGDFAPRNSSYRASKSWNILKESLLSMLLGSRRINYKGLIKDCLSVLLKISHPPSEIIHDSGLGGTSKETLSKQCNYAIAISFLEVKNCTCIALQKFLLMAMELDASRKEADLLGLTVRSDGVRMPVAEIIQDELTYDIDSLTPFFQVLNDSKWKLEIIVQYFRKYISKAYRMDLTSGMKNIVFSVFLNVASEKKQESKWKTYTVHIADFSRAARYGVIDGIKFSLQQMPDTKRFLTSLWQPKVRTRRSSPPTEDATFNGILKHFSNTNNAKSIAKKIGIEVIQSLLAHAFQAYLSLTSQDPAKGISCPKEDVERDSLVDICQGLISAFTHLRKVDEHMEIFSFGREALFTAATILSMK